MRFLAAVVLIVGVCVMPYQRTAAQSTHVHELRFADGSDVEHLNTLLITTYPELYPAQLTAAYLTRIGPHGEPVPELAREVPSLRNGGISKDGKTIVYHLRPNLHWSDGSPLTASDVVFTAERIIAKDTPVASSAGWDTIADVSSPSSADIRFQLKAPYAPALVTFFCSYQGDSILPERLLRGTADLRSAAFNQLPTGAGPFRYASFKHGDRIVMEANPFYFRGRPKLDRIIYKFVPDENTLTTQIITGEIDIAIREEPTQLLRLRDAAGISLVKTSSANTGYIGFMTAKTPFDDPRVRLALRYGIDRRQLLETVYHGAGSIWDDPVTALDPFFGEGVAPAAADPTRAAALLDSAGWRVGPDGLRRRDGRPLTVDFVDQTGNNIAATIVELVRAQWAKLGVTVNSRTINGDVVFAPNGVAARGDYGALIYGEAITSAELDATFACKAAAPHGFNYGRYCNPRVDALLARANISYDDAVRKGLYIEARRLIAADAPVIPTIHREDIHAVRANVSGFRPNGLTLFDDVLDLDVK
jgi:peptide/nickel transport system substrate-binding protein